MQEENKSLGMLKNVQFGREIFTLSPLAFITVYFKMLVSDLFHAGSALVESESIKSFKKQDIRIAPKHNNSLETFSYDIPYRSTFQSIGLTLHCKYPANGL